MKASCSKASRRGSLLTLRAPPGQAPFPAMVLVHGGGGKRLPNGRRCGGNAAAALAMDLSGPTANAAGRRPDQDGGKFRDFTESDAREM